MSVVIRLVGGLEVHEGDDTEHPGTPVPVGGRKARRLLAMLASRRGRSVSATTAVEALWGDRPPRRPEDNVAVLVSRLRAALGADVVRGGREGYRLGGPPAATVDLDTAAALLSRARGVLDGGNPGRAAETGRRALGLVACGEVLAAEGDAEWANAARNETEDLRRTARLLVAECELAADAPAGAVAVARAAVADDPLDEAAVRILMTAHARTGEPARALAVYERLRAALAEDLGVDPARETRDQHLSLLRGDVPTPTPVPTSTPLPTVGPTRIGEPLPAPRRPPVPPPAALGREGELAGLAAAWEGGRSVGPGPRRPVLHLLWGPAGIGKTTLARAFAERVAAGGALVLSGRAYAAERSLFLQPVLDALGPAVAAATPATLRAWAGPHAAILADLFPEVAEGLGGDTVPSEGELARRRAFEAVRHLLDGLVARSPVLMVLDDLHASGSSSVELLHHLARRPAAGPVMVLATLRSGEGDAVRAVLDDVATGSMVGPIGPGAVGLLAARAGVASRTEAIVRRSRGHPLYVRELVAAAVAGADGLPTSLREAVLARLAGLGPDVTEALRAAAVLGSVMRAELVATMLDRGVPEVVALLGRAAAAGILHPTGAADAGFTHDLVREIVYDASPPALRDAHHRAAADLLTDRPEALARHAVSIGDVGRAARSLLVAGQHAHSRGATVDARDLLDQALSAARQEGDGVLVGRVLLSRSRVADTLADAAASTAEVAAAMAAAGEVPRARTASEGPAGTAGPAAVSPSGPDDAVRAAARRIDRLADAELYAWRAVVAVNRLRLAESLDWGRRALALGRASGDDGALVAGLDGLKAAAAYSGDLATLRPVLDELEPLARRRSVRQVLFWTVFESSFPALAAGEWDAAEERIDEARGICRGGGLDVFDPWFLAHRAQIDRLRGRTDAAVDHARRAVSVPWRHEWFWSTAAAALGTALLERGGPGDRDEAVDVLAAGLAEAESGGVEAYVLRCLAPLAEATGDRGVRTRADALLGGIEAPHAGAWFAGADAYLAVARAHLAAGDPTAADRTVAPLAVAAAHHGWPVWAAAAAAVRAEAAVGI